METSPYDLGTKKGWDDPVSYQASSGGGGDLPWPVDPAGIGTTLIFPNGGSMPIGDTSKDAAGSGKRINVHFKDMTLRTQTANLSKPCGIGTNDADGGAVDLVIPGFEWHFDNVRISNMNITPANVEKVWMRNVVWESQACVLGYPRIRLNCNQFRSVHSLFFSGALTLEVYKAAYFQRSRIRDSLVEITSGSSDMDTFTMHGTDCSPSAGNPLASGWPSAIKVDGAALYDIDGSSPQPASFELLSDNGAELIGGTYFQGTDKGSLPGTVSWKGNSNGPPPCAASLAVPSGQTTFVLEEWDQIRSFGTFRETYFTYDLEFTATFAANCSPDVCFTLQLEQQAPWDGSWIKRNPIVSISTSDHDPFCFNRTICQVDPSKVNRLVQEIDQNGTILKSVSSFVLLPAAPFFPGGNSFGTSTPNRVAIYGNGNFIGYSNEFTVVWENIKVIDVYPDTTNHNNIYLPDLAAAEANPNAVGVGALQ